MKIHFKLSTRLEERLRSDLTRSHAHAAERVGFVTGRFGWAGSELLILAQGFHSVPDSDYEVDGTVGARINGAAIRGALQTALTENVGMFHVHLHEHRGVPRPSAVDWSEWVRFVPNFWHVRPNLPHGALLFSADRIAGWCWYPGHAQPERVSRLSLVGSRLQSFKELAWTPKYGSNS
jgi:hypothetical protein